jgi:hypothetical protein
LVSRDAGQGGPLPAGEVLRILTNAQAGSLEGLCGPAVAAGAGLLGLSTDLVQRLRGPGDDMEWIQTQPRLGCAIYGDTRSLRCDALDR